MNRAIGAVVAGAGLWAALWIGGNLGLAAAFPDIIVPEQAIGHAGILVTLVAYSVALSLLAGFVTAAVKGGAPMGAVWSLAGLQLALGVFFEVTSWALLPVWYHLVFLALIVPAVVWGGRLRVGWGSPG